MTAEARYDLVIVGGGWAGQAAALTAAALGARVAIAERHGWRDVDGGTGMIPSRTLRAAIAEPAGVARQAAFDDAYATRPEQLLADMRWRATAILAAEHADLRRRLTAAGVEPVAGAAHFVSPHELDVTDAGQHRRLAAEWIVIAVGLQPLRPTGIDFDDRTVVDSDSILRLVELPRRLVVIGAGLVGLEYASLFAATGAHVRILEQRAEVLSGTDADITAALLAHLRTTGVDVRLSTRAIGVTRGDGVVHISLEHQPSIESQHVLFAGGQVPATSSLDLAAAGLESRPDGRIDVDANLCSRQPHILVAGAATGTPRFGPEAASEGRRAAAHALGGTVADPLPRILVCHALPELAATGLTEEAVARSDRPYVTGIARFSDTLRGQISGDTSGLLKLVVGRSTRTLLGAHMFGGDALETIHLARLVIDHDITVDELASSVFAHPSFSEAYAIAATDAIERLAQPIC